HRRQCGADVLKRPGWRDLQYGAAVQGASVPLGRRLEPLSLRLDAGNSQHGPRDRLPTSLPLLSPTWVYMICCLLLPLIDLGGRRHRVSVLRLQLQTVIGRGVMSARPVG